ncbi:MAG: hypothetical protein FWE61_02410 [Micrococcales bacterium]|nr:hypothetical protein [Micrococcales bacterium]
MHGENQTADDTAPRTHDPDVDAIVDALAGVGDLPLAAQVDLLDDAHQRLQDRLAQSSQGGGAR